MAKTFNACFLAGTKWPVAISISDKNGGVGRFYLTSGDARDLASILECPDTSGGAKQVYSVSSGGVYRIAFWKKFDLFVIRTTTTHTLLTVKEASMFALQLRHALPPSSSIKGTETVVSPLEAIVEPNEDLLAGARQRMDDNLRHAFG